MAVDAAVRTFGPFLVPVALFVLGAVGYGLFLVLIRRGVLPWGDETRND
jgi:hypothetical protein